jgi:hypothetical protein
MPEKKPKIKKKTIIEEKIEDPASDELELNENGSQITEEEEELSPAEQMSELIDLLKREQHRNFYIKIFKRHKQKKQWLDTIYEPDAVPDETEIRDLYGGGTYELMLIYNDPETNRPRVKSITYNIFEPVTKTEDDEEEEFEYDIADDDFNRILALMIERDKEFSKQIIAMQQNQFNMILNLINQQQTNMINLLATLMQSQRSASFEGVADLIETVANISGLAPEKNPIIELVPSILGLLLNLQNQNAKEQNNFIKKLQASVQSTTQNNLKQIEGEENASEEKIENNNEP